MVAWFSCAQVARFAARALGPGGPRPVSAPLADPTAPTPDAAVPPADAALRLTAHALLASPEAAAREYGQAALSAAEAQARCFPLPWLTVRPFTSLRARDTIRYDTVRVR